MFLIVSFFSARGAVAFASAAALLPGTGIEGTVGAFLALAGSVGVTAALGLLLITWVPTKARGVLAGMAGLVAILTAIAAWFLMQNALLAAMTVTLMALLLSVVMADRTITK